MTVLTIVIVLFYIYNALERAKHDIRVLQRVLSPLEAVVLDADTQHDL